MPNSRAKNLKFTETAGSGEPGVKMLDIAEQLAIHNTTYSQLNEIRDLILESIFYAEPSAHPEAQILNHAERARFRGQLDLLDMILTNCNILEN